MSPRGVQQLVSLLLELRLVEAAASR
jgi:hypothetical protein